ncbi:MAG TPA: hypothetical protein VFD27_02005, partial [Chthoniobacteraceae bacterium]|nr:hypothetical protein [Chthoniobacteraceae bacterium]
FASALLAWNVAADIHAQSPNPPVKNPTSVPVPPPADPFVREGSSDTRLPRGQTKNATTNPAATPPVNLLVMLETWSLSQNDLAALLDGPPHERLPYDRLEELAKAGKAKLIGLMAVTGKSQQRYVVESVDELRYPTEFMPADRAGELTFPTAWETRNTGETLEIEAFLDADGKRIDVNLVPQSTEFDGFRDWKAEEASGPVAQPQFHTEKLTTSMALESGRPAFLATATRVDEHGERQTRLRALRITAQEIPAIPPASASAASTAARVEFLVYSLDRELARHILADSTNSAQSYAAVRERLEKGEAQLEIASAFVTKSGQRAINEEILEFRYATTTSAPSNGPVSTPPQPRVPASVAAFETRNTGVTVEIEPVLSEDFRSIEVNAVPQIVQFAGMLKANGIAAKYPPSPVFTTRKVTTSVSCAAGVPAFFGTYSQPRETGVNERKDDNRTSLGYIRVTPLRP